MKNKQRFITAIIISLFLLTVSATAQSAFDFPLEGSQEVPPVDTATSGECTAWLNSLATAFTVTCSHDVTDVVGAHIHMGAAGTNAPIVFFLDADTTINSTVTQATLDQQADDMLPVAGIDFETFLEALRAGDLYVNVHSPANPPGEIRGQIPPPPFENYFAQFGNGVPMAPSGSSVFLRSDIVLVNAATTGEPATGTIAFYDQDGQPIPAGDLFESEDMMAAGLRPAAHTVDFELGPLDEVTFSTTGMGDLVSGSAVVNSSAPVAGVIRFEIGGIGVTGVGASPITEGAIVPVRRVGDISTGLAIRNTEASTITVNLSLRVDGVEVDNGSAELTLEPNARVSQFLEQYFENADTSGFEGTVVITADGAFAAIALELDQVNGLFTTLPVTPLTTPEE